MCVSVCRSVKKTRENQSRNKLCQITMNMNLQGMYFGVNLCDFHCSLSLLSSLFKHCTVFNCKINLFPCRVYVCGKCGHSHSTDWLVSNWNAVNSLWPLLFINVLVDIYQASTSSQKAFSKRNHYMRVSFAAQHCACLFSFYCDRLHEKDENYIYLFLGTL